MFVQKNRKINIKKRSAHKMQVLNLPPFPQVTTGNKLMSISSFVHVHANTQTFRYLNWAHTIRCNHLCFFSLSVRRHGLPAHARLPDICTSRLHILITHVLMSSWSFPACVGSSSSLTQGSALGHTVTGVHKPVFKK